MAETPNVCPQLHMPMQSGSDAVLRAMRRSYRRDRYLGDHRRGARRDARTPRSRPTSSSASRARPRPTSSRRWTRCGWPGSPARSPSSTPTAAGHARGRPWPTGAQGGRAGAIRAAVAVQDDISWAANQALLGQPVEVLVTGEGRKDAATGRRCRAGARRPARARRRPAPRSARRYRDRPRSPTPRRTTWWRTGRCSAHRRWRARGPRRCGFGAGSAVVANPAGRVLLPLAARR